MENGIDRKKITVLLVDDSAVYLKILRNALAGAEDIVIIGEAHNGKEAVEFINSVQVPDIISLDIEMPVMDGIDTLKAVLKFNERRQEMTGIGVIMVSSHTQKGAEITIKCLEMGAFDFIGKPVQMNKKDSEEYIRNQLLTKIRVFSMQSRLRPIAVKHEIRQVRAVHHMDSADGICAVGIGISTGGPKALTEMLPALAEKITVPVLIVQHMPELFTASLADSLKKKCCAEVVVGSEGLQVRHGVFYIAPGGRHMLVRKTPNGVVIGFSDSPPENGCRPSADVLFRSMAAVYGSSAMGILMTGMGTDGTSGFRSLANAGAELLIQDEASSVVWGMPGSAAATGLVKKIIPLKNIADEIAHSIYARRESILKK